MTQGEIDPISIIEQWDERAWGNCDTSAVDDLVGEKFVRHGQSGTVVRSREELKQDLRQYKKALGTPIIEVLDRTVDGDKVWSRTRLRGAHLETGELRTVERLQIHRIEDGRIVEVWLLTASDVEWDD